LTPPNPSAYRSLHVTRKHKIILVVGLALTGAALLYWAVLSLNVYREMMKINTGSLWRLPTRIYSAPFELAPGVDTRLSGISGRLSHLSYRKVSKVQSPGHYRLTKSGMEIYLHPFEYVDVEKKAHKIRLVLDGTRVTDVISVKTGEKISPAYLEPECIATIYDEGFEDREIIQRRDCPDVLIDALLCVEDRRFYDHSGFDIRSMARALLSDVFHAQVKEGGSTITQQLAKNLFLSNERTVARKLKELWLSTIMEGVFTKDEILAMYVNEIYLGRYGAAGIYGFGRASRLFFDKSVADLNLHEAALLVGIIRAPNIYSPYTHPKTAIERRNTVLAVMRDQGKISQEKYDRAVKRPLGIVPFVTPSKKAPYFIDHILSSARGLYPQEDTLAKGGLRIFTTLDMHMQRTLDEVVNGSARELAGNIQVASVVINPKNGAILAMVGGRDYRRSQYNRVISTRRNIGSLIKPIIYYSALKNGYTLASLLDDSPLEVSLENKSTWAPVNYDNTSHGNIMLVDALANSYNQATVRLGLALGFDRTLPEMKSVLPKAKPLRQPSVYLGALSCSPLEVAGMYCVFASSGSRTSPWCLEAMVDENGAQLFKAEDAKSQMVLDPVPTFLLNTALMETIRRGTARAARNYGVPDGICGKTGTTNDLRDSWFAAYTPDMVIIVWLGDDRFRTIGLTGATGAMPIAAKVLARTAARRPLPAPEGITFCEVDPANGKKATTWTEAPLRMPFLAGTEPKETSEEGMPGLWKALKNIFPAGE